MRSIKIALLFLLLAAKVLAQTAPQTGVADIKQEFKKLNVLGSVLYVANRHRLGAPMLLCSVRESAIKNQDWGIRNCQFFCLRDSVHVNSQCCR